MIAQDRIKKLIYRSWHRGCKETDILLGDYAKLNLNKMSEKQLDEFEKLIETDDSLIYDILTDKVEAPQYLSLELIEHIKSTIKNKC